MYRLFLGELKASQKHDGCVESNVIYLALKPDGSSGEGRAPLIHLPYSQEHKHVS